MRKYSLNQMLVLTITILFIGATITPIITANLTTKKNIYLLENNKDKSQIFAPIANFTYEPINPTINDIVYFNSTSYDPNATIVNYTWYFGDGDIAYGEYVTHQYNANGTYLVNLTVINNESESDSIEKNIFVGDQPPVADFTFNPEKPITNENVYFTDKSNDPDGIIINWWWNFGDGYYSDLQNPVHIYYTKGSYIVELTVKDDDNLISTIQKTIVVYVPNYPPSTPSNPNPEDDETNVDVNITLSWTCIDPDEDPLTYDVYFGNTTPPQKVLENHNNTSWTPGTLDLRTKYYWSIVARDDHNNSKEGPIWSFTTVIPQNSEPNAPFINGPQWAVVGQPYTYELQSSDPEGDNIRYIVSWGDNTENTTDFGPHNTLITIDHTWNTLYPIMFLIVTVRAEDIYGAISNETKKIIAVSWIDSIPVNVQQYLSQLLQGNLKVNFAKNQNNNLLLYNLMTQKQGIMQDS